MNRHRSMHLPLCLRPAVAGMAIGIARVLCLALARPALAGGRLGSGRGAAAMFSSLVSICARWPNLFT